MAIHSKSTPRPAASMRTQRMVWLFLGLFVVAASLSVSLRIALQRMALPSEPPVYAATAYVIEQPTRTAEKSTIPVTCENVDRRRAERWANALADCYAADQRRAWQQSVDAPRQVARVAVDRATQTVRQAQERLDAFRRRMAETPEPAAPPQPAPTLVDNPRWAELNRKIQRLQLQREGLLQSRTSLHPMVLDVNAQINDLYNQMANLPRQIWSKPPAAPPKPVAPSARSEQLASLSYEVENARKNLAQAEQTERQLALQSQSEGHPQWTVIPAETAQPSPTEPLPLDRPPWMRWAKNIGLPSLLALVGLTFLWRGASVAPLLGSVEQVAQWSGAPVAGVLDAENPVADPLRQSRRQTRTRRARLTLGLLLIALAPLAVFLL